MDNLISVIVPVFNNKQYLERCIESIQNQTYRNLEIILVDDGSTDGSSEMCDRYAGNDERIRVIHKANGGVTSSRKAGLAIATGKYAGFVDSDDWIEKSMYEEMLQSIIEQDCDVACFAMKRDYGSSYHIDKELIKEGVYEVDNYILDNMILFENSNMPGILHSNATKLFITEEIRDAYLGLKDSVNVFEDAVTTWICILKAKKILVSDKAFYHYCLNMESATRKENDTYFIAINEMANYFKKQLDSRTHSIILEQKFDKRIAIAIMNGLKGRYSFLRERNLISGYVFDFERIDKSTRTVLYGAGRVGQDCYKQLQKQGITPFMWVDKRTGGKIRSIEEIKTVEYDYIYIAILSETAADEIKKELLGLGVSESKIIWKQPVELFEYIYGCGWLKKQDISKE